MANVIVPWPGPVPDPGASNVTMVAAGRSKAVSLKFCAPSIALTDVLIAAVPRAGSTASTVCDNAKQAKRTATRRKKLPESGNVIGPLTQRIMVDLRSMSCFICFGFLLVVVVVSPLETDFGMRAARNLNFSRCLLFFLRY